VIITDDDELEDLVAISVDNQEKPRNFPYRNETANRSLDAIDIPR